MAIPVDQTASALNACLGGTGNITNLGCEEPSCGAPRTHGRTSATRTSRIERTIQLAATGDRLGNSAPIPTDTPEFWLMPASDSGAITGSVTDGSDAAPVERWRAACDRQDAAATDVGMYGPDWRVEPQPQQVTTRVLRRVAVVESGACMQLRPTFRGRHQPKVRCVRGNGRRTI